MLALHCKCLNRSMQRYQRHSWPIQSPICNASYPPSLSPTNACSLYNIMPLLKSSKRLNVLFQLLFSSFPTLFFTFHPSFSSSPPCSSFIPLLSTFYNHIVREMSSTTTCSSHSNSFTSKPVCCLHPLVYSSLRYQHPQLPIPGLETFCTLECQRARLLNAFFELHKPVWNSTSSATRAGHCSQPVSWQLICSSSRNKASLCMAPSPPLLSLSFQT